MQGPGCWRLSLVGTLKGEGLLCACELCACMHDMSSSDSPLPRTRSSTLLATVGDDPNTQAQL